jgi:hypothetical protein
MGDDGKESAAWGHEAEQKGEQGPTDLDDFELSVLHGEAYDTHYKVRLRLMFTRRTSGAPRLA